MGKPRSVLFLPALALAACLGGAEKSDNPEAAWTGTVRSTCGIADGPAIRIEIRSGVASCSDTGAPVRAIFMEGPRVDSLLPGREYAWPPSRCEGHAFSAICYYAPQYRLQIEAADARSVEGWMEIRDTSAAIGTPPERVRIRLSKCPDAPPMCG